MVNIDDRVAALEERIERLERELRSARSGSAGVADSLGTHEPPPRAPVRTPSAPPSRPTPAPPSPPSPSAAPRSLAPQVLGISGVAAIVLAASYLVRLALDAGWLTPLRQVAIASVAGLGIVLAGLALERTGRRYAALLSAAGVVILFLTCYGAHLLYGFIQSSVATALVSGLCLLSLGLGRFFDTRGYSLIAVVGAYSTPFLVQVQVPDVTQLVLYYSAWSALFCGYSLWLGGRHTYLVASLLAVVGFDLVWRAGDGGPWVTAALYQTGQFMLFSVTAAVYSVRHRSPMGWSEASAHLPSLLFFYWIQYALLEAHIPGQAPWLGLASIGVVLGMQRVARARGATGAPGAALVSSYAAMVLLHSGYMELVPGPWEPWVALALFCGVGLGFQRGMSLDRVNRPLLLAAAVVCALNYLRFLADMGLHEVPAAEALYVLCPILLYAAFALTATRLVLWARCSLLYAAHVAAMVAVHRLVDVSVWVSVLWGALAVGSLVLAVRRNDRPLAQSSFLVFGVSAAKVMLYDLEGSAPLIRIGCLVALGVSLYAGGWLYQRLGRGDARAAA